MTKDAQATKRSLNTTEGHVEPAVGSEEENRKYCSKEKNFVEFGRFDGGAGQQGRRTDLSGVVTSLKNGETLQQIAEKHTLEFIKFHAGIKTTKEYLKETPKPRDVHVTVLWGPTGVGKTHRIFTAFPNLYRVILTTPHCWDEYQDQEVLFMDEFDPSQTNIQTLNGWLDKWPLTIGARFYNKQANWTKVYIASNSNPSDWYALLHGQRDYEALQRRLTEPIGRSYEVLSQEQEINLNWWVQEPPLQHQQQMDYDAPTPLLVNRRTHPGPDSDVEEDMPAIPRRQKNKRALPDDEGPSTLHQDQDQHPQQVTPKCTGCSTEVSRLGELCDACILALEYESGVAPAPNTTPTKEKNKSGPATTPKQSTQVPLKPPPLKRSRKSYDLTKSTTGSAKSADAVEGGSKRASSSATTAATTRTTHPRREVIVISSDEEEEVAEEAKKMIEEEAEDSDFEESQSS